jgi:hypothetical protein
VAAPAQRPPRLPRGRGTVEVRVPDIGDFKDVAVIELLVKVGDTVKVEQSLSPSSPTRPRWKSRRPPPACSRN